MSEGEVDPTPSVYRLGILVGMAPGRVEILLLLAAAAFLFAVLVLVVFLILWLTKRKDD